MRLEISYSCSSHAGNRRDMNQDNFICDGKFMEDANAAQTFPITGSFINDHPVLFGVFDGMGGAEHGEIASHIAANRASQMQIEDDPLQPIVSFVKDTNKEICDYVAENELTLMGTTAAMIVFTDEEAVICNIGDSKVYRYKDHELKQVSEDHVGQPQNGKKPPLTQCLGIPESTKMIIPHIEREDYTSGTTYLICSDGLTDMVPVDTIREYLSDTKLQSISEKLLKTALKNGGKDNVTFILCRINEEKKGIFERLFGRNPEGAAEINKEE